MFAPLRYIAWTKKFYGKVAYDLASSGVPLVSWSEVGPPPDTIDDLAAYGALREAIARYNDVPLEEVVPAVGTSNAIFLAYAATLSPGDDVLLETPGYEPLVRTAEGLGANVRTFARRAEDDFAIDPEIVAAAITPRTRLIVVTTLHNPTGVRTPDATLRELARIAEARGAYLLVDEVYAPFDRFADDGIFRGSARKIASNVIAIGSLTKCYGLGMYRVGWLLGPEGAVRAADDAAIATVGHLPLLHASYGVRALDQIAKLGQRARSLIAGKREIARAWTKTLRNVHWSDPAEGLFGMLTLHGRGDLLPRIEATARTAGVIVGAGSFFGAPESFRLSWGNSEVSRFREALDRLDGLVK